MPTYLPPSRSEEPPTFHLHALRNHLKAHHAVVMIFFLLQLLLVEVEDEGKVVVEVELEGIRRGGREGKIKELQY